jgi:hypothetical protein
VSGVIKDTFAIQSASADVWTGGEGFVDAFVASPTSACQSDAYVVSAVESNYTQAAYVESPSSSISQGRSGSLESPTQVPSPVTCCIVKCKDSESEVDYQCWILFHLLHHQTMMKQSISSIFHQQFVQ